MKKWRVPVWGCTHIYIYIYIYIYIRHRARACEARVWRDRSCRRLYGDLGLATLSWMDWSFTNIRATIPSPRLTAGFPSWPCNHFFGLQLRFKIWLLFKIRKSTQIRPASSQNPLPNPFKTAPKRHLILQTPNIKNNATLSRFCSFLTFPGPRKSSPNRCRNAFKISFVLDTLLEPYEIRFLMLKRLQNGSSNFPIFFKNRLKILTITVFDPKYLLEATKSLPRATQELPKSRPSALKRHTRAF